MLMATRHNLQYLDINPIARYVVIYKSRFVKYTYCVGIMDNGYNYTERPICLRKLKPGWKEVERIRSLFFGFRLVKGTKVIFTAYNGWAFTKANPIVKYVDMVGEHVHFVRRYMLFDRIPRRIRAFHRSFIPNLKDSQINRKHRNKVWTKVIERKCCPWITEDIANQLTLKSKINEDMSQVVRLGMYYCVVSQYLNKNTVACYERKAARLAQEQAMAKEADLAAEEIEPSTI